MGLQPQPWPDQLQVGQEFPAVSRHLFKAALASVNAKIKAEKMIRQCCKNGTDN